MTAPVDYPRDLEHGLRLSNGAWVRIRPILPEDEPRLVDLVDRLTPQAAYQRFFTVLRRLPAAWARTLANVDYRRRLALVAERPTAGAVELVAVARYEATPEPGVAEVAFVVRDDWQNLGLGTRLLRDLLAAGAARGVESFVAYVLADNVRMLDLLQRFTVVQRRAREDGVIEVRFTPAAAAAPAGPARVHGQEPTTVSSS